MDIGNQPSVESDVNYEVFRELSAMRETVDDMRREHKEQLDNLLLQMNAQAEALKSDHRKDLCRLRNVLLAALGGNEETARVIREAFSDCRDSDLLLTDDFEVSSGVNTNSENVVVLSDVELSDSWTVPLASNSATRSAVSTSVTSSTAFTPTHVTASFSSATSSAFSTTATSTVVPPPKRKNAKASGPSPKKPAMGIDGTLVAQQELLRKMKRQSPNTPIPVHLKNADRGLVNSQAPDSNPSKKPAKAPQIVVLLENEGRLLDGSSFTDAIASMKDKVKFHMSRTGKGYRIFPDDMESHKLLSERLKGKAQHFSHDPKGSKAFQRVVRGLDRLDSDDLRLLIEEATGSSPSSVQPLGQGSAARGQLFLVKWPAGAMNSATLNSCRYLGHYKVTWEAPKKREPGPTQCTRCARFGHGQRNCQCSPVCLFCAEPHLFSVCVAAREPPQVRQPFLRCFNCALFKDRDSNHAANDKSCQSRAEFVLRRTAASKGKTVPKQSESKPVSRPGTPAAPIVKGISFADALVGSGSGRGQSSPRHSTDGELLQRAKSLAAKLKNAGSEFERRALALEFILAP